MLYGLTEYAILVVVMSVVASVVIPDFLVYFLVAAPAASVVNMLHEAWVANFDVNSGWTLPMFVLGTVFAAPIVVVAGLPMLALRTFMKRKGLSQPTE